MKIAFAFLMAALVLIPAASAAPTGCANMTLDFYIAGGFSCSIGNLVFSNFGYNPTGSPGLAIPANAIDVQPLSDIPGDEGFQFSSGWAVKSIDGTSNFQDSLITFTVSTLNQAASITDLSLSFNGDFTGTGATSVNEAYCPGGAIGNCPPPGSGVRQVTNPPPVLDDHVTFTSPVSTLGISKDINATSGTDGTARISQVINRFSNSSSVPEPATSMLIGGGLLGLGLMRRRTKRS